MAHAGRDLKTLSEPELLEVRVEEVQYEANVWANVSRTVEDIVGLVSGLRLLRERYDPSFFGEAVQGHADVAEKVGARCGEGVVVTKKIQSLLAGFADHYSKLAADAGRTITAARPVPAPPPQPTPTQWQENLRARLGLPSLEDVDKLFKKVHEGSAELARNLQRLSTAADDTVKNLETTWRSYLPGSRELARAIMIAVAKVLEWTSKFFELIRWVAAQINLPAAMYEDALKWIAMRNHANGINTWLSVNVLNPERGYPTRMRQQAWHGDAEAAYAAAIPAQEKASGSVGLIAMVTGGSLMGCFGSQVYVVSVLSSIIIDVIKFVVDLIAKIRNGSIFLGWFELVFGELVTWTKNGKEAAIAVLQAEATSKFQADLARVLVDDNSAFAYRADLQLYTSVAQLPTAWPDPTRAGAPWPRERPATASGARSWEVSRSLVPPPLPAPLAPLPPAPRRGTRRAP